MKSSIRFTGRENRRMSKMNIFLFGAAEKGELCKPIYLHSLDQLLEILGNPPETSEGILCAIQALLLNNSLIYFRVEEEGFSYENYLKGFRLLHKEGLIMKVSAVCMPGMANSEIWDVLLPICRNFRIIILMSEKDLYDYLTEK